MKEAKERKVKVQAEATVSTACDSYSYLILLGDLGCDLSEHGHRPGYPSSSVRDRPVRSEEDTKGSARTGRSKAAPKGGRLRAGRVGATRRSKKRVTLENEVGTLELIVQRNGVLEASSPRVLECTGHASMLHAQSACSPSAGPFVDSVVRRNALLFTTCPEASP